MTDKSLAEKFEEASKGWVLPAKNDEGSEVQYFTVETDDPQALDDFLKLFGGPRGEGEEREFASYLVTDEYGDFAQIANAFVVYTKVNGPYIHQMISQHDLCRSIKPLEVSNV